MARPKGGNKKPEKEEHDDRHRAVIEAIRAKRQECLEALEKSDLLAPVKFSQEISRISCPSRPSLPLAQASKLAAHCAIALHLRAGLKAAEDAKLQHAVIWLISKAVTWAWEGTGLNPSRPCLPCTANNLHTCADLPESMHACGSPWLLYIDASTASSPVMGH